VLLEENPNPQTLLSQAGYSWCEDRDLLTADLHS
jgi:hypothetical protein